MDQEADPGVMMMRVLLLVLTVLMLGACSIETVQDAVNGYPYRIRTETRVSGSRFSVHGQKP